MLRRYAARYGQTGKTLPATNRLVLQTRLALAVLCLAATVNLLQSAVISPLLPDIATAFAASDAATGQLATMGAVAGFAFSIAATPWMDRWSRRTWFRLEGAMILVGMLMAAFAPTFPVLAVGRVISACGASLIMANCFTGARELFKDPARRNRAIGFIASATTLVFVAGLPVITQINAFFGWRVAMAAIAIPTVLLLIGTQFIPAPSATETVAAQRPRAVSTFRAVLGDRRIRALLIVLMICSALYSGWFVYFGAYTTTVFDVSAGVLGLLFLLAGAAQLVANNVAPVLVRRFNPVHIVMVSLLTVSAVLLSTGIAIVSVPGALLAAVTVLVGTGLAYISTNVLLLDSETPHPGAVMSLSAATGSLGAALGPLIAGAALAASNSFEVAYRVVGALAPFAVLIIWLGTRQPAVKRAEAAEATP